MDFVAAMQIFTRVAELEGFTAAATSLGLPKATVSVAIQQLENHLGTRLLQRTTRRVQMTHDGRVFYERCGDLLAEVEEVQNLFVQGQPVLQGRLRVDMPLTVARDVVLPHLSEFLAQHPLLEVELSSTDRRVDVVREGFDCVLRVGALGDVNLVARPVGQYRMINVVSPSYLARYGEPKDITDLAQHRLVHYAANLGGRSVGFEYVDEHGQVQYLMMSGALTVNNSDAYLNACLAGLGIIQSPEVGLRHYIKQGLLVPVLSQWTAPSMPITWVYAHRRHLPLRVRVFMAWLTELMQRRLQE